MDPTEREHWIDLILEADGDRIRLDEIVADLHTQGWNDGMREAPVDSPADYVEDIDDDGPY